jgi:glucosamine--fructose-6-phosphate aminotransferase (isomerizing)
MLNLIDELIQQPAALREMIAYYKKGIHLFDIFDESKPYHYVFTGMGASYHAAWIGALHLNSLGIPATAVEATDLFNYSAEQFGPDCCLVYISQSGSSGEVSLLQERLRPGFSLVAITNHSDSPLAQLASLVLPMMSGEESLIASKTYLNPLAILWLSARRKAGCLTGNEWERLEKVADRVEEIYALAEETGKLLDQSFDLRAPLLFLGHGPGAATARQASMILSEWAKVPAYNFGIGAFRHGFIEAVQPGVGAVVFASPGRTQDSARKLAGEVSEYGARVLRVENGSLFRAADTSASVLGVDEFLAPILDILPFQIWTERLARARGIEPGFRYISKVVRSL